MIILLIGSISLLILVLAGKHYLEKRNKLEELSLHESIYYDRSDIELVFDSFIMGEYEKYKLFNVDKFSDDYLNDNKLEEIGEEVLRQVLNNISLSLLNMIALIYNKDNMYSIIRDKVWMIVINDGVQHNADTTLDNIADKI